MWLTAMIARRLALGVLTLWLAATTVFFATQVLPGNSAEAILGFKADTVAIDALAKQLGLDRPVLETYGSWLGNTITGDLGQSLVTRQTVAEYLGDAARNSAFLVVATAVVAIPLAIFLGAWSGMRRDGWFDHVLTVTSMGFTAVPSFAVGVLLVITFATTLTHWLPAVSLLSNSGSPWESPANVVLPLVTLCLVCLPYPIRLMRASMIEALESEYVQMARLKGLRERDVIRRYAVPNAIAPTIQASALTLAYLAGGIVVVESVFNYPGIGTALIAAITSRDLPVIQAIVLVLAAVYVIANLIADVLVIMVSPRMRTGMQQR